MKTETLSLAGERTVQSAGTSPFEGPRRLKIFYLLTEAEV